MKNTKRILSLVLALAMIVSVMVTFTVAVSAEGGTEGWVPVVSRNYESGTSAVPGFAIKTDNAGNKYAAVKGTASSLVLKPGTSSEKRIGSNFNFRINFDLPFTYVSGKQYRVSWKTASFNGNVPSPLNVSTSGMGGLGKPYFLYYTSATPSVVKGTAEVYTGGFRAIDGDANSVVRLTASSLASGWRQNEHGIYKYKLTNTKSEGATALEDGSTGTVPRFFCELNVANTIKDLMIANKAYQGTGLQDSSKKPLTDTFEITDADLYGDEEGLTDNGGSYTRAQLCKVWSMGEDCSALKSAQRTAAFQTVLEDYAFGTDDYLVEVNATLYEDTVTVGKNGKVMANTVRGLQDATASTEIKDETKAVETNDYYNTEYEVVPDNGYVATATVDGTPVTITENKFTVTADGDHTVAVTFKKEFKKVTATQTVYSADFKTGSNVSVASSAWVNWDKTNGQVVITLPDNTEKRAYITFSPAVKLGKGRKYKVSSDIESSVSSATLGEAHTFASQGGGKGWASLYSNVTTWGQISGWNGGAISSGRTTFTADLTVPADIKADLDAKKDTAWSTFTSNGGTAEYDLLKSFQPWVQKANAVGTQTTIHSYVVEETVDLYPIAFDIGDGSAKVSGSSLNLGDDVTSYPDGDIAYVEQNMAPTVTVYAPEGYKIDTISYTEGEEGTPEDYTGDNEGKSYAVVTLPVMSDVGILSATYSENTVDISEIQHISLEDNVALYKGTTPENNVITLSGYNTSGEKVDLTGASGVTYTSSDASVFTVSGNKLTATGKNGVATITATVDGTELAASFLASRSANACTGGSFQGDSYLSTDIAFQTGVNVYAASRGSGDEWRLRFANGRGQGGVGAQNIRTVTGYFYDDGVSTGTYKPAVKPIFQDSDFKAAQLNGGNWTYYDTNYRLADFMSYGQFDWSASDPTTKFVMFSSGSYAGYPGSGDYYASDDKATTVKRSKGWHQVVGVLAKDPTASYGWVVKNYIDGQLVSTAPIYKYEKTIGTDQTDCFCEIRTRPSPAEGLLHYYAGLTGTSAVCQNVDAVKVNVGANGKVYNGANEVSNGGYVYEIDDQALSMKVVADTGYEIEEVAVNGTPITVTNDVAFDLSVADGDEVTATFVEQTPVDPSIAPASFTAVTENFEYTPKAGGENVSITGKKSLMMYATFDKGTFNVTECGFYLKKGTVEVKLPAISVPTGTKVGIRAFGAGLAAGSYTITPYIVKEGGEEIKGETSSTTIE